MLKNNARAESKERLDIALDTIDGLAKPLLEQGLIDLEGRDISEIEKLLLEM